MTVTSVLSGVLVHDHHHLVVGTTRRRSEGRDTHPLLLRKRGRVEVVSFVGVDVVRDGSECPGLHATGWCRLSGRFERIFSKRHHDDHLAPDEGECAAREDVRDGFMLLRDSSCRAFRQRFEQLRKRGLEAIRWAGMGRKMTDLL
ncbi:MAG TPA: hypothetical protein VIO33_22335 [Burkholderiaceae bacterium]